MKSIIFKNAANVILIGSLTLASSLALSFSQALASPLAKSSSPFFRKDKGKICEDGFASFSKNVFPHIRNQCIDCHDGSGPGPAFAVESVQESYFRVRNYLNPQDLESSTFLVRASNGHCGIENCNEETGQITKQLVSQWWNDGENDCQLFGKRFITEQTIPIDLPENPGEFKTLTWDLSTLDVGFIGLSFSIDIQRFASSSSDAPGAYLLIRPRIKGDLKTGNLPSLSIQTIRPLINWTFDTTANGFEEVNKSVSKQMGDGLIDENLYPVLSTRSVILLEQTPGKDSLAFAFETFDRAPSTSCKSVTVFSDKVWNPIVASTTTCFDCHGGGPTNAKGKADARQALSLVQLDEQAICNAFLERIDFSKPHLSPVVDFINRGKWGHPVTSMNSSQFIQSIKDWTASEK